MAVVFMDAEFETFMMINLSEIIIYKVKFNTMTISERLILKEPGQYTLHSPHPAAVLI